MRIEIRGGPHDGGTVEISDSPRPPSDAFDPQQAAAFFAGVPIHQEEGRLPYLRWSDLEGRAENLRSIGPAIDRVLLMMHEHEFDQEGTD